MNEYIVLDGKRYKASHGNWSPVTERAMTIRMLLSGHDNVTFGPAPRRRWEGQLIVPAQVSDTNYGTIADLRATLEKMATLAFVDHYGDAATVVVNNSTREKSFSPKWDAPENEFNIPLTLTEIR